MKLLLDQNLAPRLVAALATLYPDSTHVREVGLATADDNVVWRYAADQGFTIVSKDADFHERSFLGHRAISTGMTGPHGVATRLVSSPMMIDRAGSPVSSTRTPSAAPIRG